MKTKIIITTLLSLASLASQAQIQTEPDRLSLHQILMPYDRIVQSAGMQIYFGDRSQENHSLDAAISPDYKWIAVEERFSIVFISTADKKVAFVLNNDAYGDLQGGMNTYSGIIWHRGKKGLEVLWSTIGRGNRSYVASAIWDGTKASFGRLLEYKPEAPSKLALPNEILISTESSKELIYVILNGNNKV